MLERDQPQLIWGLKNIGDLIGRSQNQTWHLAYKGKIPVKRVGGRWVAERGKLLEFLMTPDAQPSNKEDAA